MSRSHTDVAAAARTQQRLYWVPLSSRSPHKTRFVSSLDPMSRRRLARATLVTRGEGSMPRQPDTVVTANVQLQRARRRLASPSRPGKCMSRSEFVTAVNAHLHANSILDADIDADYVVKLESGKHRWPRDERRRLAIQAVLGVHDDAELGFHRTRRSRLDDEAEAPTGNPLNTHVGQDSAAWAGANEPPWWSPNVSVRTLDRLTATAAMHGHTGLYSVALQEIQRLDHARRSGRLPPADLAVTDARWSEFLSWIGDNDGHGEAGQWLSRAFDRAVEAQDPHLRAYVLMRQSQRAIDSGNAPAATRLARQALQGEPLPPRIHALCQIRLAEALALRGDDDSLELGVTAGRRAESPSHDPADAIAQHCDHPYVTAATARCRYLLGDHRSAATILEEVLTEGSPSTPLDSGMWLTYLADAYGPHDPERAANTATQALTVARRYTSARIVRALLPLAITLRPYRGLEPVDRFLDAHREALTDG